MKILLVSPTDPPKPGNVQFLMGGEHTYTQTLLSYPPDGVEYVHFLDALAKGDISFGAWSTITRQLQKLRILPLSAGLVDISVKGTFDLIHCHAYALKLSGRIPVVLSDSSSNEHTLRYYFGWGTLRIRCTYFLQKLLYALMDVCDGETGTGAFRSIIVFSEFAKGLHRTSGLPSAAMRVIHPGVPDPGTVHFLKREKRTTVNILFVGTWFERKGGRLLVDAYRELVRRHAHISLTIIGNIPLSVDLHDVPNVSHKTWVPHDCIVRDYYPHADIFVLVPPKAEGYGFVVVEAMSFGIPVIVTNVCALPELVEHGKSGLVIKPGSLHQLTDALEQLIIDKTLRRTMSKEARKRFLRAFSIRVSQKRLTEVYKDAIRA